MGIDFSSAIDNALLLAAREAALRRPAGHPAAVQFKPGRWGALPASVRPQSPVRLSSASAPKANPVAHAH